MFLKPVLVWKASGSCQVVIKIHVDRAREPFHEAFNAGSIQPIQRLSVLC